MNPNGAFAGVDKSSGLSYEATGASSAARHDTAIAGTWQYTWDDGWNLFGLPLAQEYKKQTGDNVPTYLYCYTGVGSYGGYKTIDISDGSTKMQPYTSYYAQTSALTTATYAAKGAAYALRHEMFNRVERFVFRLNLNGEEVDVTTLIFDEDASADYVINEDAVKLSTTGNCIWNAYDNAKYVFNRLPFQGDTMCFQLQTQLESGGDYTLAQLNDVAEAMTVYVREIGGNWNDLSLSDFVITDNGVTVLEVCFIKASMEEWLLPGL